MVKDKVIVNQIELEDFLSSNPECNEILIDSYFSDIVQSVKKEETSFFTDEVVNQLLSFCKPMPHYNFIITIVNGVVPRIRVNPITSAA